MFPHDGQSAATDLSHWLGPLSPAFAAMAAGGQGSAGAKANSGSAAGAPGAPGEPPMLGETQPSETPAELRALFHTLNNQLGVILTYAELLEAKAQDDGMRSRASQIVSATIEALGTSKRIRNAVVK
jgi:hypothetical protein